MNILFVYVNTAARAIFPVGLSSLATVVSNNGHKVEIFDTTFYKQFLTHKRDSFREKVGYYKTIRNPISINYAENSVEEDLRGKIFSFRPDIIGFSILSAHFDFAVSLASFIKQDFPNIPIIFGGFHPTLLPELTIEQPPVDMICVGEGEFAFTELLERMQGNQDITTVKGIWVKEKGTVYKNEPGRLADLDKLPLPDYSLFSEEHLFSPLDGKVRRIVPAEFSRGCPFSCAYCSINFLRDLVGSQKYLRRKSVETVIRDLLFLKNRYNVEMFYFEDETFLSIPTKALVELSIEYKRQVGVPFHGLTYPMSVTEEKVKILKEMGCYLMTVGVECGNEEFRRKVLGRPVSNKRILQAFSLFRKYGIHASAFGMLGLPHETRELVFETIDLFRACKPRTYSVGIYKPFLGSALRDMCIKEGFFNPANDTYNYPDTTSVLNMPQFPKEEIEGLYKTFFLYTKLPQERYGDIRIAESDDMMLTKLVEEYRNKEEVDEPESDEARSEGFHI